MKYASFTKNTSPLIIPDSPLIIIRVLKGQFQAFVTNDRGKFFTEYNGSFFLNLSKIQFLKKDLGYLSAHFTRLFFCW